MITMHIQVQCFMRFHSRFPGKQYETVLTPSGRAPDIGTHELVIEGLETCGSEMMRGPGPMKKVGDFTSPKLWAYETRHNDA